ncbi:MAG: ribosome assembly cofactor RimP [Lutibacter sp.]
MEVEKIENLVNKAIENRSDLFLIDLKITGDNKIFVEIDGDNGVALQDCINVSRAVEHNLDREEEDFSLEVTSPDIAKPLKIKRQYFKNINRTLQVIDLKDNLYEGKLTKVGDSVIFLEWKTREPKPIGKGKVTVIKEKEIAIAEIKEAKVKLVF